ncbi:1-aminocyclopropane-1-carboxylate synthase 1 [Coemansia spiralis]|nr:1-aminocyclopropane-1-carboxylate synthase 1 [Coemansia spiralis]
MSSLNTDKPPAAPAAAETKSRLPKPSSMYMSTGLDVWTMMNQIAASVNAVNLGQGYMSFPPKEFIKKAAQNTFAESTHNQYAPPRGRPALLGQLGARFTEKLGRPIDPNSEVSVHAGANEALLSVFTAFLEHCKGHEVILMEPAFDHIHQTSSWLAASPYWKLDINELESAVNENTRILVLNTPHNPVGKVFTREELEAIGAVAERHNLLIVSDEVYEHLTYDVEHVSIATLPGMWDRTITVGSAGKLFGVTGWRVGWAVGPEELIKPTLSAHTRIVFTSNTPLQEGIAASLKQAKENDFFNIQRQEYQCRRDRLTAIFDDVGLPYVAPDGAYYLLANASSIRIPQDYDFPQFIEERGDNFKLVYFFTKEFGVSGIPPTEFYSDAHKNLAKDYIRFAFCKTDKELEEAKRCLQKLKEYLKANPS